MLCFFPLFFVGEVELLLSRGVLDGKRHGGAEHDRAASAQLSSEDSEHKEECHPQTHVSAHQSGLYRQDQELVLLVQRDQ